MSSQLVFWVQFLFVTLSSGWLWLALCQPRLIDSLAPAGLPSRRNNSRSQFSTEGPGSRSASFRAFTRAAWGNLSFQVHGVQTRRRQLLNRLLQVDRRV